MPQALDRTLPPELEEMEDLALDLRFTASHTAGDLWERLDAETWERTRNPYLILLNAHQSRLDEAARDKELLAELGVWLERRRKSLSEPGWFDREHGGGPLSRVAYFSMEFGLSEGLPIHSGGLGILAGDHLKAASDEGVPIVGLGLLYQQGYFRQLLGADGYQLEAFPYNDPGSMPVAPVRGPDGRWPRVRIELPGRPLYLRTWQVRVGKSILYLLDSNDPLNMPWDRGITSTLYAAGKERRLLQEIALGVGGWRLLEKLGIEVDVCHLNEGHAAFVVLARAADIARDLGTGFAEALRIGRAGTVFTTHTPVEAAFDKFDRGILDTHCQPVFESLGLTVDDVLALGRRDPADPNEPLNMAYLALRNAAKVNGVSRLHGEVSRRLFSGLFPGRPVAEVPVSHVTNGVHVRTWYSAAAGSLWEEAYGNGGWSEDLEAAATRIGELPDEALWTFRASARGELVRYVRRRLGRQLRQRGLPADQAARAEHALDPNALTLGFARRFTAYKRPTMLLHDRERLARLLSDPHRPVQLIVAGKAHPNDGGGKELVRQVAQFAFREDLRDRVVFLEDYDMVLARNLVSGVDVWLNAPRRPVEACGTSGMKTLVNGGLNLSILDGWWDEAYDPEVGWAFGDGIDAIAEERDAIEAEALYAALEQKVVPMFYERDEEGLPRSWIQRVRASMVRLTPAFCAGRMVREYAEKAYLPAAAAYRKRAADGGAHGREIQAWRDRVRSGWRGLRIADITAERSGDVWRFSLMVYLGDLAPEDVRVEVYTDSLEGREAAAAPLDRTGSLPGTTNGHRYAGQVPADRPAEHYTPRIVPWHPDAFLPLEAPEVWWYRR